MCYECTMTTMNTMITMMKTRFCWCGDNMITAREVIRGEDRPVERQGTRAGGTKEEIKDQRWVCNGQPPCIEEWNGSKDDVLQRWGRRHEQRKKIITAGPSGGGNGPGKCIGALLTSVEVCWWFSSAAFVTVCIDILSSPLSSSIDSFQHIIDLSILSWTCWHATLASPTPTSLLLSSAKHPSINHHWYYHHGVSLWSLTILKITQAKWTV